MPRREPEEIVLEIEEWLRDPFNESFIFERPHSKLNEISPSREPHIGEVLESLTSLSRWYAAKGIVEVSAGKSNDGLCDSFWCDSFYNAIMWHKFQEAQNQKGAVFRVGFRFKDRNESKPRISFNDQGLLLSRCFSLGLIDQGEVIGRRSLIGLERGCFYGTNGNKLTPFVLSVFAKWKDIPFSVEKDSLSLPEPYKELLQKLTQSPEDIKPAIIKACDFHWSRSKENTDQETFEFADPVYAVYPVEILMVFRIRELLGLSNPDVPHPLLSSGLGKLPNSACSMNVTIESIRRRIEIAFPGLSVNEYV